ncbi:hypothetical protein N658DRAFT_55005 [Parathielavia hyrcaniae]|uniref:Uncharacterized protein n=1 Tax=Parathielavia hyrcaniae TaxID=113614 RepID=A0AAN6PV49_9PEZI|nr:hypothetical protein N658DRAFT_55005 [Parathielavia hyrcaniae]
MALLTNFGGHRSVVGPCPTISCTQLPLAFPPPHHIAPASHTITTKLPALCAPASQHRKCPSESTGPGSWLDTAGPPPRTWAWGRSQIRRREQQSVRQQILHASVPDWCSSTISPGSRSPACS